MAEKQLIVVVEGTAAMGPYWPRTLTDYLEKIIRAFGGCDLLGQKPAGQTVEMSLVMFTSHCTYTACLVQRSGWTRDIDVFLSWLFALCFSGGGFNDAAVTEGLIEALMMFPADSTNQNQQNAERQKHCILIAASNPNPIPSPMSRLQLQSWDQGLGTDNQAENRLCDAQTVSKLFAQRSISLSVISPKLNPLYRAIYNAGKRNPQTADPPIDNANNPYFLVLISENFTEACSALSRPGVAVSMKGPIMKRQPNSMSIIPPPATVKIEPKAVNSMVSGSSIQNIPSASRPLSQGISNFQTSSPISTPQEMLSSSENLHEMNPIVGGFSQPLRLVQTAAANVNILNNLSQARQVVNSTLTGGTSIGLQSMGITPINTMHMSNMISSGVTTSVPVVQSISHSAQSGMKGITLPGTSQVAPNPNPTSFSSSTSNMSGNANTGMSQPMGNLHGGVNIGQPMSGMNQGNLPGSQMVSTGIGMNQNMMNNSLDPVNISSGTGTMVHIPGMSQQAQLGGQSIGASNSSSPVMPSSKQNSGPLQGTQSKYVRIWEGSLSGHRQGQHVFITRLEGYRNSTSSETLADNWPQTMQIVRLISQDHMNNKHYTGKADFLVFRAMNQHGFLGQLQDKKLCAVIQLPSQTLLLSVSDKACRLIGMLFPGDMVVFKPQISSQPQPQQQHQGQARTQMQQQPQSSSIVSHLQQQQQPQSSSNVSHLQQHQQPQSSSNVSHLQQRQPMVASGMGQNFVQNGSARSGLISQGQSPSSGSTNFPRQ